MRVVCSVWLCGVLALQCVAGCTFDSSGSGSDCDSNSSCSSNSNNANTDSNANANANTNGNDNDNNNNPSPEYCTNEVDDDGDGLIDCDDPDCSAAPSCQTEDCGNSADDDGDGLIDCDDPDCSAAPVCVPEVCTNGVDDDGDGLTDCDDPECASSTHCATESCASGVDEDGDGLTDCDDDDCLSTPECGVCNPISNAGCAAGTNCYLDYNSDWFGGCQAAGGGGGQWAYCDEATDCQLGYYCSGSYYYCMRVCHPGSSDCGSIPGTHCLAFSGYGSNSPWGVCVY